MVRNVLPVMRLNILLRIKMIHANAMLKGIIFSIMLLQPVYAKIDFIQPHKLASHVPSAANYAHQLKHVQNA